MDILGNLEEILDCHISGFHEYVLEKPVHLAFVSQSFCDMLGYDGEELLSDSMDLYTYVVHPADRKIYTDLIEKLMQKEQTLSAQYRVLKKNGEILYVSDMITTKRLENGTLVAYSVLSDITDKYRLAKSEGTRRYVKALTEIYDKIFEYDFSNKTVKCLYGEKSEVFKWLQNIPMQMEEAMKNWIEATVVPEDKERVSRFFADFYGQRADDWEGQPPQVEYRAQSSCGGIRKYVGIFLKIDASISLFCCRSVAEEQETDSLRSENDSLRSMNENMQELVMHFTDGIVAFEIENDCVKPLYASDNVSRFFGYTTEEWVQMSKESHSIKKFVAKSGVEYEKIQKLLTEGEAEFEYMDVRTSTLHKVKAVCSHKYSEEATRRYVMLYNINENVSEKVEETSGNARVYIRTFGYFDVFVDDKPIAFRNEKSKELFALLVDRRGGYVSSEEAIGFLWEDEAANSVTLARYRKVALRLKNILEEYGISDIVESVNGRRRIVIEKVECDLYDYLSQKEEYAQLFKGSYLTNYSWGEITLGELLNESGY